MKYKVLITTSGIGSRLGEMTKYTNKALVRIGNKPVLAYIIDSYPKNIELVITVGYFADHIKQYIKLAYPKRKITLVPVDKYQGEGTSLAYSMLQAKNNLQCPFIFHACDTIVAEPVPVPDKNWNGGYKSKNASQYSSFSIYGNKVTEILDKGAIDYDYLHIGLVGINNYKDFWQALEYTYLTNPNDPGNNDCRAINLMLKNRVTFIPVEFNTWLDIGNIESLNNARKNVNQSDYVLDKVDESIYFQNRDVIKFFSDKTKVQARIKRAKLLKGIVPEITQSSDNFYKYHYVEGLLYSKYVSPENITDLLFWAKKYLWKKINKFNIKLFQELCLTFYKGKTLSRINQFFNKKQLIDNETIINNIKIPKIKKMIEDVDFNFLSNSQPSQFHGDFIPDNIIKTKTGYCLLDWRQDFAGNLEVGDMYYDLAKFNHNLTVNHDIINRNLFTILFNNGKVRCDILQPHNLVASQMKYHQWLQDYKYDLKKVKLLTSIIWLNMSPLHHHPFDIFLFYFGKLNLYRNLYEKE